MHSDMTRCSVTDYKSYLLNRQTIFHESRVWCFDVLFRLFIQPVYRDSLGGGKVHKLYSLTEDLQKRQTYDFVACIKR